MKWTEERKKKHSEMAKSNGYGKWMSGKKHSPETKEKMSNIKKGKPFSGISADWNGKKHSSESKKKMSNSAIGRIVTIETRKKISNSLSGENSYLWKGGITPKNTKIRNSTKMKEWRLAVFKRDDYTCQECNIKGVKLNAHHIKSFSQYPELRLDVDNGRTLCVPCHEKTDNFKRKALKDNPRIEIIITETK